MKSLSEVARGILITFGIIRFFFFPGIFAFFPFFFFFSYKPWFFRWSICPASPIWNGALWESSFAFGILSITGASVRFAAPITSLLLGPHCSFAGVTGPNHPSYTILFPFPCADFPNLCKDPSRYEWYHLTLQILDLCSSLATFCAPLVFVMTSVRLLPFGHLNMSIGHGGEGGLPAVMPLARRVAWLCNDRQIPNALTSGSEVPLKPRASFQ
ncbi:LOW QUALITY PROTEIN: transmembrane protein 212 [Tyto alba]|uniref:LOW QUALITY PROTEIN: transmembrane protein 212 n=1 Tax=Tyto alba TaxID=56313 RepID=UPI001C67EA1D|nr:LOW QUALITY PROTEIN: transmembrane protein 212 [Tyto alba]